MLPLDNFDLICGVPYAALPMATAMSLESYIPLIIKRKEAKAYGTKNLSKVSSKRTKLSFGRRCYYFREISFRNY